MRKILLVVLALCISASGVFAKEMSNLKDANAVYLKKLSVLVYSGHGDVHYWADRAKKICFESVMHLISISFIINNERDFGAKRSEKLKEIALENRLIMKKAKVVAYSGHGDVVYWKHRTQMFATEMGIHCANIAGLCDKKMLNACEDKLMILARKAKSTALIGYGDAQYWSTRCKKFATSATYLLGEITADIGKVCK